MSELVLVERNGAVAIVTLNRPEAMNALSRALRGALFQAITDLSADDAIACIVLTGAGDRAFTAGLDLKELGSTPGALGTAGGADGDGDPVRSVEACPKPIIAAVNGVAITGGFELALACDIIVASERARFADTHARVGVMPGWGLSQRLSRRIGIVRAKELSLSGNFLDAATAERWGLVNRVVPAAKLLPAALALARDIASADPAFIRGYKALIDDGYALPFGEAMALERERAAAANRALTPDALEARRGIVIARGRSQAIEHAPSRP